MSVSLPERVQGQKPASDRSAGGVGGVMVVEEGIH